MLSIEKRVFRVLTIDEDEMHVFDYRGMPLVIDLDSKHYSDKTAKTIDKIKSGNRIMASLSSFDEIDEAIESTDGAWCFDEIEILNETRFYHGKQIPITDSVKEIFQEIESENLDEKHKDVTIDGFIVGHVRVVPVDNLPSEQPQTEKEIQERLEPLSPPPYEVFFTLSDNEKYDVTYYFADAKNMLASRLREAYSE